METFRGNRSGLTGSLKQPLRARELAPPAERESSANTTVQCFVCKKYGHKSFECRLEAKKQCFCCNKLGREARECCSPLPTVDTRKPITKASAALQGLKSRPTSDYSGEASAGCVVESGALPEASCQLVDQEPHEFDGELSSRNGSKNPIVSSSQLWLPGVCGKVGDVNVSGLQDTGCSGVILKQRFVPDDDFTGKHAFMQMVNNTSRG